MRPLRGSKVIVAGAGVLGVTVALRLVTAGCSVRLCDPAVLGDSASGVAAGMLAPGLEGALDGWSSATAAAMIAARDLWPGLLGAAGVRGGIERSGAALVARRGEEPVVEAAAGRLAAMGLEHRLLARSEVAALHPGLAEDLVCGLFTPEDWRLSPRSTLAGLAAAFQAAGGAIEAATLSWSGSRFLLGGAAVDEGAEVVIATGADGPALALAAPELSALRPVKGQLLHFDAPPLSGPMVRDGSGYVAPQPDGAVAGATMEPGRSDRLVDPVVTRDLRRRAAGLFPALAVAPARAEAGVRAATPDGLPLVGRSAGPGGAILCTGARRNGWLLAPLAAEVVLAILGGKPLSRLAAAMDPRRFG